MLKRIIKKIRHLGVNNHEDLLEQKRTMLLNEISLFLAVTVLLYLPQAFALPNTPYNLLAIAMCELAVGIPIWLNASNKPETARWFFCLVGITFTLIIIILYGSQMRMDFFFLLFAMISIIFFTKGWHRIVLLIFIACCQAFSIYYSTNYTPLNPPSHLNYVEILSFAFVNFGVIVIMGHYISASTLIETNLKKAVEELDTKSKISLKNQQQIREQNLKLEAANQELEKFAYIASHDLKSPLRSVNSFLKLIKRKVKKYEEDDSIIKEIDAAAERAEQMNFLIQDILDFSKIGIDSEISVVNLNEMIIALKSEMDDVLVTKNATIQLSSTLPSIQANQKQMFMLFNHLIENGLLYNTNEQPKVVINSAINDQCIIFKIKDNGIGISPKNHKVIFEMFKRLHTQEQYKGSGVGLAVCKKIVEQYGGEIHVENLKNSGTTFIINFPITMSASNNL